MHAAPLQHRSSPASYPQAPSWRWPGLPALVIAFLLTGCGIHTPRARPEKTVEVDVTTPIADEVIDYQDFTGRLDAFRTVDIRAHVTGYVTEGTLKEGDLVQKGDSLFRIDSRTFKADLAQAEANLKLGITERELQAANAVRARRLVGTRTMSREEYDQIEAAAAKAVANVGSLEAARDRAKIYVDYCNVTAPFSGRISRRLVDPGNLVKADDTILTTLVADDPVYAYFDVDERTYLDLTGQKPRKSEQSYPTSMPAPAAKSVESALPQLRFPVLTQLANEKDFKTPGVVDFLDNRLNGNTGTIRLRAVFKNPDSRLKAGLFVRVRLPIGTFYRTLLIPDEALQSDQGRKFVYVVDRENTVQYRAVELGQAIHDLRVIKAVKRDKDGKIVSGLEGGDQVVISGLQRIRPKMQVKATVKDPPKRPEFPLRDLLHDAINEAHPKPAKPAPPPAAAAN
jgi:RND family efflux transporter MFP subunit